MAADYLLESAISVQGLQQPTASGDANGMLLQSDSEDEATGFFLRNNM